MTKFEGNRYLKYNLSSTWIYQPNESKINGKGNELIRALYFLKNRHERSRKDTIYKRSYQIEWTKKKEKLFERYRCTRKKKILRYARNLQIGNFIYTSKTRKREILMKIHVHKYL